jgi:hypothetical protein
VDQFSNAELAIALLNPALRYHPQTMRLGAAMLSAEGNTPEEIIWGNPGPGLWIVVSPGRNT